MHHLCHATETPSSPGLMMSPYDQRGFWSVGALDEETQPSIWISADPGTTTPVDRSVPRPAALAAWLAESETRVVAAIERGAAQKSPFCQFIRKPMSCDLGSPSPIQQTAE